MAWGLARNKHSYRICTSVERLVRLTGGDFDALSGLKNIVQPIDFKDQDSFEDVEELSGMMVVVAALTCAGRHELFDDAEVWRFDQVPAVAIGSEVASPLVVVGGVCTDDAYRHWGNRPKF
jgi:hypothetical protein